MPLLSRRVNAEFLLDSKSSDAGPLTESPEGTPMHRRVGEVRPSLFVDCANRACTSGWLHLWRSRTTPIFESGWTCSPECTAARVRAAVMRELGGLEGPRTDHRHRIPLGLLMLEHGWITQTQLRRALDAQKRAGTGRLGHWLVRQGAANESLIARALAVQWSCPVLSLEGHDPAEVSAVIPRLFVDAFGALPLRVTAGKVLYLGFEESLDPALALAVERMTGLRVEGGIVQESSFRPAHARMLKAKFPSIELVESVSETAAAFALARSIERARPVASRLVRVHECLWLRMWQRPPRGLSAEDGSIRDVVCSIGAL
jgi:Type II secretion system (T2SS), protein E, N-terminal domain